ncbi:branched-chain amino acid ABC transporter permease [Streptomyces sp. NPDC005708]|uniref:branched-chain amino acid ABC transporter permease n=1 Tax=Streptomyces sp. NPDC005708 TaxID=3154564 RepID=UPI0033D8A25E
MFNWLDPYSQFVGGSLLVDVLLVLSLFVVFQCGVLSLASVGFCATGAYIGTLLSMKGHWPVPLCIIAATLGTGLLALIFGRLVLRLKGIYLALGSFALGQVCVLIIANIDYTGGNEGIVGIPTEVGMTTLAVTVVVCCVLLQVLHQSRAGRALRSMRLDDRVAAGVGVNTAMYRTWAFTASAAIAGMAGAMDAFRTVTISPSQYSFTLLVEILAMAMIGGSFHWSGGLVAAFAIGLVRQKLGDTGPLVQGLLYGGLLVVVMLLLPEGVVDRRLARIIRRLARRLGLGTHTGITGDLASAGGR